MDHLEVEELLNNIDVGSNAGLETGLSDFTVVHEPDGISLLHRNVSFSDGFSKNSMRNSTTLPHLREDERCAFKILPMDISAEQRNIIKPPPISFQRWPNNAMNSIPARTNFTPILSTMDGEISSLIPSMTRPDSCMSFIRTEKGRQPTKKYGPGGQQDKLGKFAVHLWVQNNMTDLVVRVGNISFQSHKAVLTCYSPFFKKTLLDPKQTDLHGVELQNVDPDSFEVLLTYMYTGKLKLTCENLGEVYKASRLLLMAEIVHVCVEILSGKVGGAISTLYLFVTSKKLNNEAAKKRAFTIVTSKFKEVVESVEFLQLNVDNVREILSADSIGTGSELPIYLAALKWLNYHFLEREMYILDVLKCVRFPLMNLEEILTCFHPPLLPGIAEYPEVFTLIMKSLIYVSSLQIGMEANFYRFSCVPRHYQTEIDSFDFWDPFMFNPYFYSEDEIIKAVKTIQFHYKTIKLRRKFKDHQRMAKAAIVIQKYYKGYKTRQQFEALKLSKTNGEIMERIDISSDPCFRGMFETSLNSFGFDKKMNSLSTLQYNEKTLKPNPETSTLIAIGGFNPDDLENLHTGTALLQFNPITSSWASCGKVPQPRHHHCAVYLSGLIYVIGGCDPRDTITGSLTPSKSVFTYSFKFLSWKKTKDLIYARIYHGAASLRNCIYVVGGKNEKGEILKSVESFDPLTEIWLEISPMPFKPRMAMGVTSFRRLLWIVGGVTSPPGDSRVSVVKEVECYDPIKNIWIKDMPSLPKGRGFISLVEHKGELYVFGGMQVELGREVTMVNTADTFCFNLATNTWDKCVDLPFPCHGMAAASLDDSIYITGGLSSNKKITYDRMERFQPEEGVWHTSISLPDPMACLALVTLPSSSRILTS